MISFRNQTAETVQVGDVMRQVEESKTHTDFDHYRATSVFVGDVEIPIHIDGVFLGNRIDRDVVQIEWSPVKSGRPFTMRYTRTATVEISTTPVTDVDSLVTYVEHSEEV
jgi:hypothetical protein